MQGFGADGAGGADDADGLAGSAAGGADLGREIGGAAGGDEGIVGVVVVEGEETAALFDTASGGASVEVGHYLADARGPNGGCGGVEKGFPGVGAYVALEATVLGDVAYSGWEGGDEGGELFGAFVACYVDLVLRVVG